MDWMNFVVYIKSFKNTEMYFSSGFTWLRLQTRYENIGLAVTLWCFAAHTHSMTTEKKTKTFTVSSNLISGTFQFAGWMLFMSTGGRVCRPCITALWPSNCHLWGWNHYFSKGAVGLFVWCGLRVLYGACGRMLRARWIVYASEYACARRRACDMAGVHQSKGCRARRLAAPDSALQEGLVWWRAHSESSIPQDKS